LIYIRIVIVTGKHFLNLEPNVLLIACISSGMNYIVMTIYSNCA